MKKRKYVECDSNYVNEFIPARYNPVGSKLILNFYHESFCDIDVHCLNLISDWIVITRWYMVYLIIISEARCRSARYDKAIGYSH